MALELVARKPGRGTQCYNSDDHVGSVPPGHTTAGRDQAPASLDSTRTRPTQREGGRGPRATTNTSVAGHPTPTPGKAVDKAHGPYREPTPTTLIPEGFEPRRWHTTNREAHMGPQHAPFQVHADSARQAPQGDSEFRRGHPSFSRAAGRDPTRAGIGLKVVPDSFHRKRNSANPPPVTTRPSRGGPRCTAFPCGPTTRTRRSSVIRRRAASLVMARVAT